MKKILIISCFIFCLGGSRFSLPAKDIQAQNSNEKHIKYLIPGGDNKVSLTGIIIDNHCAEANKDNLPQFIQTHTKACVLMKECAASGFSLYTKDGKLMQFTADSNKQVENFLKKPDSTINVQINAEKMDDNKLQLITIKNKNKI